MLLWALLLLLVPMGSGQSVVSYIDCSPLALPLVFPVGSGDLITVRNCSIGRILIANVTNINILISNATFASLGQLWACIVLDGDVANVNVTITNSTSDQSVDLRLVNVGAANVGSSGSCRVNATQLRISIDGFRLEVGSSSRIFSGVGLGCYNATVSPNFPLVNDVSLRDATFVFSRSTLLDAGQRFSLFTLAIVPVVNGFRSTVLLARVSLSVLNCSIIAPSSHLSVVSLVPPTAPTAAGASIYFNTTGLTVVFLGLEADMSSLMALTAVLLGPVAVADPLVWMVMMSDVEIVVSNCTITHYGDVVALGGSNMTNQNASSNVTTMMSMQRVSIIFINQSMVVRRNGSNGTCISVFFTSGTTTDLLVSVSGSVFYGCGVLSLASVDVSGLKVTVSGRSNLTTLASSSTNNAINVFNSSISGNSTIAILSSTVTASGTNNSACVQLVSASITSLSVVLQTSNLSSALNIAAAFIVARNFSVSITLCSLVCLAASLQVSSSNVTNASFGFLSSTALSSGGIVVFSNVQLATSRVTISVMQTAAPCSLLVLSPVQTLFGSTKVIVSRTVFTQTNASASCAALFVSITPEQQNRTTGLTAAYRTSLQVLNSTIRAFVGVAVTCPSCLQENLTAGMDTVSFDVIAQNTIFNTSYVVYISSAGIGASLSLLGCTNVMRSINYYVFLVQADCVASNMSIVVSDSTFLGASRIVSVTNGTVDNTSISLSRSNLSTSSSVVFFQTSARTSFAFSLEYSIVISTQCVLYAALPNTTLLTVSIASSAVTMAAVSAASINIIGSRTMSATVLSSTFVATSDFMYFRQTGKEVSFSMFASTVVLTNNGSFTVYGALSSGDDNNTSIVIQVVSCHVRGGYGVQIATTAASPSTSNISSGTLSVIVVDSVMMNMTGPAIALLMPNTTDVAVSVTSSSVGTLSSNCFNIFSSRSSDVTLSSSVTNCSGGDVVNLKCPVQYFVSVGIENCSLGFASTGSAVSAAYSYLPTTTTLPPTVVQFFGSDVRGGYGVKIFTTAASPSTSSGNFSVLASNSSFNMTSLFVFVQNSNSTDVSISVVASNITVSANTYVSIQIVTARTITVLLESSNVYCAKGLLLAEPNGAQLVAVNLSSSTIDANRSVVITIYTAYPLMAAGSVGPSLSVQALKSSIRGGICVQVQSNSGLTSIGRVANLTIDVRDSTLVGDALVFGRLQMNYTRCIFTLLRSNITTAGSNYCAVHFFANAAASASLTADDSLVVASCFLFLSAPNTTDVDLRVRSTNVTTNVFNSVELFGMRTLNATFERSWFRCLASCFHVVSLSLVGGNAAVVFSSCITSHTQGTIIYLNVTSTEPSGAVDVTCTIVGTVTQGQSVLTIPARSPGNSSLAIYISDSKLNLTLAAVALQSSASFQTVALHVLRTSVIISRMSYCALTLTPLFCGSLSIAVDMSNMTGTCLCLITVPNTTTVVVAATALNMTSFSTSALVSIYGASSVDVLFSNSSLVLNSTAVILGPTSGQRGTRVTYSQCTITVPGGAGSLLVFNTSLVSHPSASWPVVLAPVLVVERSAVVCRSSNNASIFQFIAPPNLSTGAVLTTAGFDASNFTGFSSLVDVGRVSSSLSLYCNKWNRQWLTKQRIRFMPSGLDMMNVTSTYPRSLSEPSIVCPLANTQTMSYSLSSSLLQSLTAHHTASLSAVDSASDVPLPSLSPSATRRLTTSQIRFPSKTLTEGQSSGTIALSASLSYSKGSRTSSITRTNTMTSSAALSRSQTAHATESPTISASSSATIQVEVDLLRSAVPQISFGAAVASTAAAGVGALTSGAASLEAPMMAMIGAVSCGSPSGKKASSSPSPLMYVLSPYAALGLDAMLFGNIGTAAAFAAGNWLVARGLAARRGLDFGDVAVTLRFPSWAIKIALLALNGIMFAGFALLQEGQAEGCAGVVYMTALIGLAEVLRRRLRNNIYFAQVARRNMIARLLLPPGVWRPANHTKRFGVLFSSAAPGRQGLALHPVVYGVCFALVSSFDAPMEYCYVQFSVLALMALGLAAFVGWFRPYRGQVTNVLTVASSVSISCTLWCTVAMLRNPTAAAEAAAGVFSTITTVLLLLKTLYNIVVLLFERDNSKSSDEDAAFWGESVGIAETDLVSLFVDELSDSEDRELLSLKEDDADDDVPLMEAAAQRLAAINSILELQRRQLLRCLVASVNPETLPDARLAYLIQGAACHHLSAARSDHTPRNFTEQLQDDDQR